MEILISLLILGVVCAGLWYVSTLLPAPIQKIVQVVIVVGAIVWLLVNIRPMIHAIAAT